MLALLEELAPRVFKEIQCYQLPGIQLVEHGPCITNNGGNNPNQTEMGHRDVNESQYRHSSMVAWGRFIIGVCVYMIPQTSLRKMPPYSKERKVI
jgi:hypothetical protein